MNPDNPVIIVRSISENPNVVAVLGAALVTECEKYRAY
nr:hypothetical protein [Pseudoalteromonas sp. S1688]